MKNKIIFVFLSPFILLCMGCLLLYFLLHIRINRDRSYSILATSGKSVATAKLKIAIVAKEFPPHISNLSAFTAEIARALVALGHQVHVVTMGENESNQLSEGYWIHQISSGNPLIFSYIKSLGFLEAGNHLANSYLINRRLVALEKKYKFDIVEFPESGAEGLFYCFWRSRLPFVLRFHTSEGFNHQLNARQFNLDRFWVRTMEKYWIIKAKAVIGVSNDIVKKYEHFYHLDLSDTPVIPYPIGAKWFDDATMPSSKNSDKVLFVGQFDLKSGPHILLQAIPKILDRSPHTNFVFVAVDAGLRKYCDEIVDSSGIAPNVTFLEQLPRDQMIDHYRNAKVCVFPSQWDNFPYICIEAMASGCAVVATDVGGFPEIIENKVNGLLVEAGDADSLADAIVEVLTNDELRDKIRINAHERIKSFCDAEKVALRSLEIYREVINL
jgi:glycosyltransferase involved in cell wall biosynthesis